MLKHKFSLVFVLFFATSAWAQFTTVTGTVTDPNGLPYANGTITPLLVTSASPYFTASPGIPYTPPTQAVGLNSAGSFVMRLADNSLLTPAGTKWNFTVCSGVGTVPVDFGKGSICFSLAAPITISGGSQSISANLNAVAPALTVNFGGGGAVSGAGTGGFLPIWAGSGASTTLGNSDLTFTSGTPLNSYATPGQLNLGGVVTSSAALGPFQQASIQNQVTLTGSGSATPTGLNISVSDSSSNASASVPTMYGIQGTVSGESSATAESSPTNLYGLNFSISAPFANNSTNEIGAYFQMGSSSTGGATNTITNRFAYSAFSTGVSGTVTNDAGFYVAPSVNNGITWTHHYGLYVGDQTGAGSGSNPDPWAVYTAGTTKSQFGGSVNLAGGGTVPNGSTLTIQSGGTLTCAVGSTCPAGSGGYSLQVGGSGLTSGDTVNFNNTTPVAGTNGLNIQFQTSKVATTDSISGEIVGDGNTAHFLRGDGTWNTPAGAGTVTSSGYVSGTPLAAFSSASNITPATYANVVALFSSCSGSQYLGYDGNCHTAAGAGTVTTTGTMTTNALLTSNSTGGTVIQTPSTTATLDSSGNLSLPGQLNFAGSTSGSAAIDVAAIAGSPTTLLLPTADPTPFYTGNLTLPQVFSASVGGGVNQASWQTPGKAQLATDCTAYASPSGSAAWPGTLGAPMSITNATLANGASQSLAPGAVVCMLGGTYLIGAQLAMGAAQSGRQGHPFKFEPYGDSPVLFQATSAITAGSNHRFFLISGSTFPNGPNYIEFDGRDMWTLDGAGYAQMLANITGAHHINFHNFKYQNMVATGINCSDCDYVTFNHLVSWKNGVNPYAIGSTGVVNTSGTSVSYVSGTNFVAGTAWEGATITINSVTYVVASSPAPTTTSLSLTTSAGTQTGVAYAFGTYNAVDGSALSINSAQPYDTYSGFHNYIVNNIITGEVDSASTAHSDGNGIILDNDVNGVWGTASTLIANNLVYGNGGRCIETNRLDQSFVAVVNNTCYQDGLDASADFPSLTLSSNAGLVANNFIQGSGTSGCTFSAGSCTYNLFIVGTILASNFNASYSAPNATMTVASGTMIPAYNSIATGMTATVSACTGGSGWNSTSWTVVAPPSSTVITLTGNSPSGTPTGCSVTIAPQTMTSYNNFMYGGTMPASGFHSGYWPFGGIQPVLSSTTSATISGSTATFTPPSVSAFASQGVTVGSILATSGFSGGDTAWNGVVWTVTFYASSGAIKATCASSCPGASASGTGTLALSYTPPGFTNPPTLSAGGYTTVADPGTAGTLLGNAFYPTPPGAVGGAGIDPISYIAASSSLQAADAGGYIYEDINGSPRGGSQIDVGAYRVTNAIPGIQYGALTGSLAHQRDLKALFNGAFGLFAPINNPIFTGTVYTPASTTSASGLNIPPGAAPTAPNNGDVWTTSAGMFAQINGGTVGPFGSGGGGANTALSNLATVAVNLALSPGTDNSISLDSLSKRYINAWLSGVYGWTNGSGTADTGLSRDAAGTVDVGNGTASDTSGTVQATAFKGTGTNGGLSGTEGTGANAGTPGAGTDLLYPDSTLHNWHGNINNSDVGGVAFASNTMGLTNKSIAASEINSGQLAIAQGGTAAATAPNALINLFPTASEVGDLLYCSAYSSGCTTWSILSGNTSGTKYLQETSGGAPSWTTPSGAGTVTSSSSAQYQLAEFTTATNVQGLTISAGQILQGATSAYPTGTPTPTLGVAGSTAGTLTLANSGAAFSTTLSSGATANNTVKFFASVPTNLDLLYCAVTSTTCTLTDTGYNYNAVPLSDLATGTANSLIGYNNSGVASVVTVGSGLSLTSGTLTATGGGGGYSLQVGGSGLTSGDTVNFNNTTPVAGTNGLNIQFQTSKVATTDSISGQLVGDGNTGHFLRGDGTWNAPAGSGTVTVVGSGNLGSTQLVTGGGSQSLQTPSSSATLSSGGALAVVSVGTSGSNAGFLELGQGTSNSTGTTSIRHQAPASVTSYIITEPAAAPTNQNSMKLYGNSSPVAESWQRAPQVQTLNADASPGATTNTLGSSGMTFAMDANTAYRLDCIMYMQDSVTSGAGFTLGVTGPGTPTQVTLAMDNWTTQTAKRSEWSQGSSWGAKLGATATTYDTNPLPVRFTGLIENGSTAGTLTVEYANIGTTGTTTLKRGSSCELF